MVKRSAPLLLLSAVVALIVARPQWRQRFAAVREDATASRAKWHDTRSGCVGVLALLKRGQRASLSPISTLLLAPRTQRTRAAVTKRALAV